MTAIAYISLWFRAFAVTSFSEAALATPLLKRGEPSWKRRLSVVLLVNVASHPAVWFIFPELGMSYMARLVLSEAWAVGLEAWAYRLIFPKITRKRAVVISLLANALSVAVGLSLRSLGVRV